MRQKLFIFLTLIGLVVLLIGLNAATYVQKQKMPDDEANPNRSTYNTGSTGTNAFYTLLSESGRKATRWLEPPDGLRTVKKGAPTVFVVVGSIKRDFTEDEAADLYEWVSSGGRLVIIDREPPEMLVRNTSHWKIDFSPSDHPDGLQSMDPADQNQMTRDVPAAKPVQPTLLVSQVNAVQPSRFVSSIGMVRTLEESKYELEARPAPASNPPPATGENKEIRNSTAGDKDTKFTIRSDKNTNEAIDEAGIDVETAPVVHLATGGKPMLADIPYGNGRIVYLSDPYVVSNAGIGLVDNAQLGINLVSTKDGLVAFDEYHQGFGANNNRLFQYFAGTPVIAIFVQLAILTGLVFFSQSRRFARPVPEPEPDRLSKLEYVSAMAELQERTRAFDLAVENIYTDFRRRTARLLGVDNYTITRREMAHMIAERIKMDANDIEDVMFQCEEIMHGDATDKKEVLAIIGRLRAVEDKLGLKRTGRTRI